MFTNEQCGMPPEPSPLIEFGLRYHRQCEAYDQGVCSGLDHNGFGVPLDGRERRLVDANALQVRASLVRELMEMDASIGHEAAKKQIRNAIRGTGRIFEAEWKARVAAQSEE